MEHLWNGTEKDKLKNSGEKKFIMSIFRQIPTCVCLESNLGLNG